MLVQLSKKIKQQRQNKNLTQTELAKDICSQGLISKIEKGEISPDIVMLSKLAKRLDVTVGYLIGEKNDSSVSLLDNDRIKKYKDKITVLVNQEKYLELEEYLALSKAKEYSIFDYDSPYFIWLDSLVKGMNYNKTEEAIEHIYEALDILNDEENLSQEDLDLKFNLYNTLSCLFVLQHDYKKAIEISLTRYATPEFTRISSEIQIQLFYGVARSYAKLEQYIDSNFYVQKAVQIATRSTHFLLLEKLYLLLAENYLNLEEYQRATEFANYVKFICEIKSRDSLMPYVEKVLSKVKELASHP